jgi:hypothetical protein
MQRILALIYLALVAGWLWLAFNTGAVFGQDNPNCHEWGIAGGIPVQCCCSNNCCSEAPASEFENLGEDLYRSNVTGQIIKRTGWSAGGFVKCACDLIGTQWVKHPKANIRCLWVPMPSS